MHALARVDDSVLIVVIELGKCLFCSRDTMSHIPRVIRRVFPHCQKLDHLGVELSIDSSHVAHVLMAALSFVCKRRCLTINKVLMVLKWLL